MIGQAISSPSRLTAAWSRLAPLGAFLRYVLRQFFQDGCFTGAGALSYTTLLALIPVTAVVVAVLSVFPVFADTRDQILGSVFRTFVPQVGAEIEWWSRHFAETAARTTAIGVIALAVTVILLLTTIEDQFHRIWQVRLPRPWVQRILAGWATFTLGPLLLAVAFSLPSYVGDLVRQSGLSVDASALGEEPPIRWFLHLLPFPLEALAFALLYLVIPNYPVRWRHALAGAAVAAVLVEVLKFGFALYVVRLASYQAIYGALAAIPIFLLWMYVVWNTVLFGAVVAAALPRWRAEESAARVTAADRLALALAVLAELQAQAWHGGGVSMATLEERLGAPAPVIDALLSRLREGGFVVAVEGRWLLARLLAGATLIDLYGALGLPLASSLDRAATAPWVERIAPAIERVASAERAALALPLDALVAEAVTAAQLPILPRTS
jgi:membrane protein